MTQKNTFASLLKKAEEEKKPIKKPIPVKLNTGNTVKTERTLFGSGITKRKAAQAERDIEKQQQQAYKFSKENDLGDVVNLNIPSTLTDSSIKLDEDQIKAVEGLKLEKYGCLIGQAGVGKTTTIKFLIAELLKDVPTIDLNRARIPSHQTDHEDLNVAVAFCSFMGKAVQQIKRALPVEYHPLCNTIHSTLGYAPEIEERTNAETGEIENVKVFRPTFTALNKLPYKYVFIDEAGSVPIYLSDELIAALPDDCRIIMMGDLNQLPPVTGRSVLGFAISKWPTFVLSKIHRQSEGNPIIENADRIIHGKVPIPDAKKFVIMDMPPGSFDTFQKSLAVVQSLHKKGLFDPLRDAFIVPQNKDTLGQIAFNEKLVRYFNPTKIVNDIPVNPPVVITAGYQHVTFAVGDKVMQLSNDRELGLTNGMIGVVKSIEPNNRFKGDAVADQVVDKINSMNMELDLSNLAEQIAKQENTMDEVEESERQASHRMLVKFQNVDDEIEYISAGAFKKITHSYAITCHKSQGGEYPTVVILAHSANLNMLSREWLYTAVTRAQERVVLLTNHRGKVHAVNRQLIKGQTIQEKAKRFIALSGRSDVSVPNLPEPQKIN